MNRLIKTISFGAFLAAAFNAVAYQAAAQSPISGSVPAVSAPDGILRPWRETDAATAATGLLEELKVKVGDSVTVGQAVAELDSKDIVSQLNTAKAQAEAEGRLLTARAEVLFYRRKLELLESMHQQNQAGELEIERAKVDLMMAEGRFRAEQDDKRVLELQVERLTAQLKERTVTAPIDGVVIKLHKEIGEFVAANTPQVIRIADVSKLKAVFYLNDAEVKRLPEDKKVFVRLSNGKTVEATVDYVLPVADGESGLIEVQVVMDNSDREILGSRCQLVVSRLRT